MALLPVVLKKQTVILLDDTMAVSLSQPPDVNWDADQYIANAGFVAALGSPVLELLNPQPGERILDLGCGDGSLTTRIIARGCTVVGVDAAPSMVLTAQARGIDARVCDGQDLPFDAEFDAVFSNASLHWMPRADDVLAGVARALKPGGRFVAELGGHGNVAAVTTALRAVAARRGVTMTWSWFFPTPAAYTERLARAGFAVESMTLIPRPTPLPAGISAWLDMFAQAALGCLPPADVPDALREAEELLRPALCDEKGAWTADYVRLRFVARLVSPLPPPRPSAAAEGLPSS